MGWVYPVSKIYKPRGMNKNNCWRKICLVLIFSVLILTGHNLYAQIVINEFMASNETNIVDEDSAHSDWIEIYNQGPSSINLSGWSLSDDPALPRKWNFPGMYLPSGTYLVIYASGKDRVIAGNPLHANFKLSADGDYLALASPQGNPESVFAPSYPPQQADVSYGLLNGTYVYFSSPTAGSLNQTFGSILPPPILSVNHGIFDSPFSLVMNSTVAGASIYYTLDGSAPSVKTAKLYSGTLSIDKTSVVRAVTVKGSEQSKKVTTSTYIFPGDIIRQPNNPKAYPAVWGKFGYIGTDAPADYEMDPEMMADPVFANKVQEALRFLPTVSITTSVSNLFSHSADPDTGGIYVYTAPDDNSIGRGWKRPVSFEYFSTDCNASFQVDCGMEIHGGESRRPEKSPKHSFGLVFKSEYGPSKLEYPLFGEGSNKNFNSLVLRAGYNNSWIHHYASERPRGQYIQDIWMKDTQRAMGSISSNSIFANLYINGIYWGIFAPSENLDADFASVYLHGSPEDFDVIKDYQQVVNGNLTAWNKLMSLANAGLASDAAYLQVQGKTADGSPDPGNEALVDVGNLADYMLVNFFGGNTDWDHHNWVALRNRLNPGTGFTFSNWDTEHNFESLNENVVGENNDNCPSRVFHQLSQNADFRRLFGDKVQKYCFNGGLLTPEKVTGRWIGRNGQVEKAIPAESARWGDYRRDVHPYQAGGPFELYTYENHFLTEKE